jgi:Arc/MetJ-type ribon-helix-helix transcriptional regulator
MNKMDSKSIKRLHDKKTNPDLRIITINISQKHIDGLDLIVKTGVVRSRSEALRVAVRDYLVKELPLALNLQKCPHAPKKKTKRKLTPEDLDMRRGVNNNLINEINTSLAKFKVEFD